MNKRMWLDYMLMHVLSDGFNVVILRALQLGIRAYQVRILRVRGK